MSDLKRFSQNFHSLYFNILIQDDGLFLKLCSMLEWKNLETEMFHQNLT